MSTSTKSTVSAAKKSRSKEREVHPLPLVNVDKEKEVDGSTLGHAGKLKVVPPDEGRKTKSSTARGKEEQQPQLISSTTTGAITPGRWPVNDTVHTTITTTCSTTTTTTTTTVTAISDSFADKKKSISKSSGHSSRKQTSSSKEDLEKSNSRSSAKERQHSLNKKTKINVIGGRTHIKYISEMGSEESEESSSSSPTEFSEEEPINVPDVDENLKVRKEETTEESDISFDNGFNNNDKLILRSSEPGSMRYRSDKMPQKNNNDTHDRTNYNRHGNNEEKKVKQHEDNEKAKSLEKDRNVEKSDKRSSARGKKLQKLSTTSALDTDQKKKSPTKAKPSNVTTPKGDGSNNKPEPSVQQPQPEIVEVKLAEYNLADLPATIRQHCQLNKISAELMEQKAAVLFRVCKFLYPNQKFPRPIVDEISPQGEKERKNYATAKIVNKGKAEFKDPPKSLKKLYKSQTLRGSGGYGKVFLTKDPFRKERVALKRIPHHTAAYQKCNFTEIGFLALCDHPNIIKYYNTWHFKDEKKNIDEAWIITEFLQGGTLSQAAKSHRFQDHHIAFVAREILQGIKYLHERKWAHRDIKSSNIMMDITGRIKLIDFGLCADLSEGPVRKMLGSPFWIPPEMILKTPHTVACDIWSFAVCVLELFTGSPPHSQSSVKCMFYTATIGLVDQIPNRATSSARDFLTKCLIMDPAKRLPAEELLKHPWVNQKNLEVGISDIFRSIFINNQLQAQQF